MSYIAMVITLTLSIERHRKCSTVTVSLNDYMDAKVLRQTRSVAENIGCLEAISALCTYVLKTLMSKNVTGVINSHIALPDVPITKALCQ